MPLYSERMQKLGTENAFKIGPHITMVESRKGPVVKMNLGEPDFSAPKWVKDELIRQIQADNLHYCDPKGILSLRSAVANQINQTRGLCVTPEHVCVFPGGKPSIGFTQQIYCNPGDEIIYPSPGFPIYESFIKYVKAVPVPLHLQEAQGFVFSARQLKALITPKTKLIIVNFPANPTGSVATREQLQAIAEVILSNGNPDLRVYSDEIYENIIFGGQQHFSIASVPGMQKRTIVSSGFSKSFAWTGGRIGYAVLPSVAEADAFKNMNINYFSCVPPYNQEGGREALENPNSAAWMTEMAKIFEQRRDAVLTQLNAVDGVSCQKPGGAFYLFPNISGLCERLGIFEAFDRLPRHIRTNTSPSSLFQMFALCEHQVAVMDRRSFGRIGAENLHFLRLSIAADLETLNEGVERLAAAGRNGRGFRRFMKAGQFLL